MRRYYLFRRKVAKTHHIFYVQFTDPASGKRLSALSTGKDRRDDALIVVASWLRDGIPGRKPKKEAPSQRSVESLIDANQLVQALKKTELTTQDVLKIEKVLQEKGSCRDGLLKIIV